MLLVILQCRSGFKMADLHTVQIMRLFLIINPQLPKLTCKVTNKYPNKKSSDRMMREAKSQMNYQSDLAFVQAVWSRPRHVTLQNAETRSLSLSQRSKEKKNTLDQHHLGSSISFLGKTLISRFLCFRMLEPSELSKRENFDALQICTTFLVEADLESTEQKCWWTPNPNFHENPNSQKDSEGKKVDLKAQLSSKKSPVHPVSDLPDLWLQKRFHAKE